MVMRYSHLLWLSFLAATYVDELLGDCDIMQQGIYTHFNLTNITAPCSLSSGFE